MSRPLRIEYPDAWYHVMNRGRRRESIFQEKDDYLVFIELLKEIVDMWNLRVGAYCLSKKGGKSTLDSCLGGINQNNGFFFNRPMIDGMCLSEIS